MRDDCQQTLPLLDRLLDGEAQPDEALRTARHLSDCTHCRIQLARRRRLAEMLDEGLVDSLPVGEEFVNEVMANLPQAPPPARKRKRRRALKLAGLIGLAILTRLATDSVSAGLAPRGGFRLLPEIELPLADGLADGALRLGGLLLVMLDRLAAGWPPIGPLDAGLALPLLALTLVGLAAACGSAGALAVAMGGMLRSMPPSRSI